MKRVLMISTDRKIFDEGSGVHSRMIGYGKLFDELHIIVFSLRKHGFSRRILSDNVTAYPTNSFTRWLYITDAFILVQGILPDMPREEIVISTQDPFETGLVGYRIKKRYNIPLQVQVHTDFLSPYFKAESFLNHIRLRVAEKVIPYADCIRVVSRRIKRSLKERYNVQTNVTLLPIFTDTILSLKNTDTVRSREKFVRFDFLILMVARLEKVKNIPMAIEVMKEVVKHNKKAGLVIVGDGSERERLKELVMKHGLTDNVIFEGWQGDVVSYYQAADIFLNTSDHEGYCLALIEAAGTGCPIITTDVGVVGEVLNESNVFICRPKDTGCFTKKIVNAMNNRSVLATVSEKARADIEEAQKTKKEYLEEYKQSFNVCQRNKQ